MNPVHAFREAALAWQDLVARAHQLDAVSRLEALTAHLVHLYALGLRLPPAEPAQPPAEPAPWPDTWLDLGSADASAPPVSLLLRGLSSDVSRGLSVEDAIAGAWWRRSFDARWGTLATAAIGRLHTALVEARRGDAPTVAPPPGPPSSPAPRATSPVPTRREDGPALLRHQGPTVLPGLEPAPPTRHRSGRSRRATAGSPGVLGIRFEPTPAGLAVTAVHPEGPAGDKLQPGDLLLSIDGLPLRGRDPEGVRAALVGAIGEPRQLGVGRGAGILEIELIPVAPESLGPPPVDVQLLVFDSDAFVALAQKLDALGVQAEADPDQPGQLQLSGPPSAARPLLTLLAAGEEAGWWATVS